MAKWCLKKRVSHVDFLDPIFVNETTCTAGAQDDYVPTTLKIEFERMFRNRKTNILLPYNCEYVSSTLILVFLFLICHSITWTM